MSIMPIERMQNKEYATYRVSVREYVTFRADGYLVVRGLVPQDDVDTFNAHMDDLMAGRIGVPRERFAGYQASYPQKPEDWLRAHMLHRMLPIHEQFLLHPRVLDVLEAIIGPDVLALQSMTFFKQPGQPGQGFHQDSYYIPTLPDTLCGAWIALTKADEANGCLWMTKGSQNEPVYPDIFGHATDRHSNLDDIDAIDGASNMNVEINTLSRVAAKYPGREVKVEAEPGDVVFFGGHVLHRSHTNQARYPRRSFVGHYCNARSLVPWNHGAPYDGDNANHLHILARGSTHLPYAQPAFGTPCAATQPKSGSRGAPPMGMMGDDDDMMTPMAHGR
jgi:phytanoyl-CoA hydroxylase